MRRGFSLVEVILVVVVLAIAVPPTLAMLRDASVSRASSAEAVAAKRHAESLLETVLADLYAGDRAPGWDAVENGTLGVGLEDRLGPVSALAASAGFSSEIQVSEPVTHNGVPGADEDNRFRLVTVGVSWDGRRSSASVLVADPSVLSGSLVALPSELGGTPVQIAMHGAEGERYMIGDWSANDSTGVMDLDSYYGYLRFEIVIPPELAGTGWRLGMTTRHEVPGGATPYSRDLVGIYSNGRLDQTAWIDVEQDEWSTTWVDLRRDLTGRVEITLLVTNLNDWYARFNGYEDTTLRLAGVTLAKEN